MAEKEVGMKFDGDKLRYDLVPPLSLRDATAVLTHGAGKYAPDNWRNVENARERYFAAAQRHLWAWWAGEKLDEETGLSHLAHAICNLMFLAEKECEDGQDRKDS